MSAQDPAPATVNLTIDGKAVCVPRGTNIINAAAQLGIEIPHYCYHPHLSIPGNCRMCQVEIKGQPKLAIGCHTHCAEGMEVSTHFTSQKVRDAQAAVLEFLLINHPLDCTVCDQSGHCKLQDYHFQYNARPSRFVEEKVKKVKAEVLGPHVILDGERCIMCTRCIRFCDEITKTHELGMLNRGDRNVIAVAPGKPLDNPLSGTVVDLCPVGALTHRDWRFNSRIWYTQQTDSICPGCSTGCSVRVAARDGQVVYVKARLNDAVNKEWLCDEGRYGFGRFLPAQRMTVPLMHGHAAAWPDALRAAAELKGHFTLVFVSPNLMLEEFAFLRHFLQRYIPQHEVVLAYRERELSRVERLLVSPDYAANFRAAQFAGLAGGALAETYHKAVQKIRAHAYRHVLLVGEGAVLPDDLDAGFIDGLRAASLAVGILSDAQSLLRVALGVVFPGRSVLEKSGLMINRFGRLQYAQSVVAPAQGTQPEWQVLNRLAQSLNVALSEAQSDREFTLAYLASDARLAGVSVQRLKSSGGEQLEGVPEGG